MEKKQLEEVVFLLIENGITAQDFHFNGYKIFDTMVSIEESRKGLLAMGKVRKGDYGLEREILPSNEGQSRIGEANWGEIL